MIDHEAIDRYVSGEMLPEELLRFEESMRADSELSDEVSLYKTLQQDGRAIEDQAIEKEQLRRTLQSLNQQHFTNPAQRDETIGPADPRQAKVFSLRKMVWWSASVAAALLAFFIFRNMAVTKPDNQQLFAQYSLPEELAHERGPKADSLQMLAESLFNQKNYTAAAPVLERYTQTHQEETDHVVALGYSYMQIGLYDKAAAIFLPIANGKTNYANKAKWYTALLLLKQGKTEACIQQLQTIPAKASNYKEVVELLEQLK